MNFNADFQKVSAEIPFTPSYLELCCKVGYRDKQAMVKAITTDFLMSNHVLCIRNLKENTWQHLSEQQVIMTKILGTEELVNAADEASYDEQCNDLVEYCANFSSKFVQYFNKWLRQNLRIKENLPMTEDIISKNWTNNNTESLNHIL